MKKETGRTIRTVMPFAMLSVALLLGCQEQGSEILGPQLKKGGGGGGKSSTTATVTLASAMQGTESGLKLWSDNDRKLGVHGPSGPVTIYLPNSYEGFSLDGDHSDGRYGDCMVDPADADSGLVAALALNLIEGGGEGGSSVIVDKTSLGIASVDNRVTVLSATAGIRYVQIGVSSLFPDLKPTVTGYGDDGTTITFTMRGGVARVRSDGSPSKRAKLHCPNLGDVVAVTVERESN